ncbi:MAG: DNRLRE domain-containing protein, partial [Thermodesulfobacteriota bacterium]
MKRLSRHGLRKTFSSLLHLAMFLVVASASPSLAATLAGWDVRSLPGGSNNFGPSPMAATSSDPDVTVGGLTRGSGVGTTGTAAARAWGGNGWQSASAAAAISADDVATFTVTANSGKQVSFSSVNRFDYRRSGTGPANGMLQYQVGAGAFTDIANLVYSSTASSGASLAAIDLSGISALQSVPPGTTVNFRIVNYGGTSSTGTWYIFDTTASTAADLEIQGTVSDWSGTLSYSLTTATAGNGEGTVTGVANPYTSGSTATITANPGAASAFTGWSGCSTSTAPTIDVVMNGNKTCTATFTATAAGLTIFHVNDTHSRLTPHKMAPPVHGTATPAFEDVGGAAYMAGRMLELTAVTPGALVIDAGDMSEGNPIGDFNGSTEPLTIGPFTISGCAEPQAGSIGSNCGMTQFYQLLSKKLALVSGRNGRGMDAVVVGNHDVRDPSYVANLEALAASGVPVLSVNVRDIATHLPHFAATTVVDANGLRIGIIGYTTQAAEVGASLAGTLEVVDCAWTGSSTGCNIADYVNDLRNNQGADLVVLAAHIGQSGLVDPNPAVAAPLLIDNGAATLPEVVVSGHWHSWADTPAWQPELLNYKTTFTEAGSYLSYIGELRMTATGRFFSAANHLLRNADITPDPEVQALVDNLKAQYDAAHPEEPVDRVVGYAADDLLLDNEMRWWSPNEYPWSGNNPAGQWICDAMQWKAARLFAAAGGCDLAIETGGGVRADIPAGPVTYLQVYETFPWSDDTYVRIDMTGQDIINFLRATNLNSGFSRALEVNADDGVPTSITFNGAPIDPGHTYTVAINNYMLAHPPAGYAWPTHTTPLADPTLVRDSLVEFMQSQHYDQAHAYQVGGPRYHLNTEFSGGYRAVVTMMNDSDSRPTFEDAFIRLLAATPETLARRGTPQVPAELVNPDGTINPAHHLAEQELYRSYLGFKTGTLMPGDIIEVWGKGSFYDGNPEFVEQEGIQSHGVEFKIVGHDPSLAKPVNKASIASFWDDFHKNRYVRFLAKKAGTETVTDQYGQAIKLWDATGYAAKAIPGNIGDMLLVTGVPTMENYGLRFRCDTVVASAEGFPPSAAVSSHMVPTVPAINSGTLTLAASAAVDRNSYYLSPVADAQVASGYPTSNYGTGNNLYVQSSDVVPSHPSKKYGDERTWLKFDLSSLPAGLPIAGAHLQLWNWKAAGPALVADAHGSSTDSWTETTITWDTQPAFGTVLDSQPLDSASTSLWYQWDVSPFVQSEWAGDRLVSLVVKPASEGSTADPAPGYAFDAKEYGSGIPMLEVIPQSSAATVAQVDFYYHYSTDNGNWGAWQRYASVNGAPYETTFTFPEGYGYYEFVTVAWDSLNNEEQIQWAAQAATHYSATPAYLPAVSLDSLYQEYDGSPKEASVITLPTGAPFTVTYEGSPTPPVYPGIYAVTATASQDGNTATATSFFTIGKGVATITIGDLDQM